MLSITSRLPSIWEKSSITVRRTIHEKQDFLSKMKFRSDLYMQRRNISYPLPSIAHKMLEDGILEDKQSEIVEKDIKGTLQKYFSHCVTPEDKHEAVVSLSFLVQHQKLKQSSCAKCLYLKPRCVCSETIPSPSEHDLWLFQNVGEYGRSNNTGSLLCLVAGAKRVIRGLRNEQDIMMQHIDDKVNSTIVLFPGDNSITMDEYLTHRATALPTSIQEESLSLILLDGTSRQAKNMDRFIPKYIPRIRIRQNRIRSWLDPIRKQTEESRVCTAQAAAMILQELGAINTSAAIERAVRAVVENAVRCRSALTSSKSSTPTEKRSLVAA